MRANSGNDLEEHKRRVVRRRGIPPVHDGVPRVHARRTRKLIARLRPDLRTGSLALEPGGSVGAEAPTGAPPLRVSARLKAQAGASLCESLLALGLAAVFLANAAVAVVDPAAFTELVSASPVGDIVSGGWVAPAIALNDLCIGVALLAAHRVRWLRPPVLAWSGLWLMVVTLIKLTALA